MRQLWFDRRLAFGNGRTALVLQYEVLNKLWLPDTYFENSVKTSGQKETMAVLLYGNGSIFTPRGKLILINGAMPRISRLKSLSVCVNVVSKNTKLIGKT